MYLRNKRRGLEMISFGEMNFFHDFQRLQHFCKNYKTNCEDYNDHYMGFIRFLISTSDRSHIIRMFVA